MPSTKGEAYLQRLGRKERLKRVVHFDLSVPPGPASSANQRSEWCYTPTSVHMVLLPAGLLQSCPAVSQSACYKTVFSVLLVSFSLDLSLCLGNTVTTGSVRLIPDIQIDILISFFPFPKPFSKLYGWFPISRSTSWCLFFPSQSLFQNFMADSRYPDRHPDAFFSLPKAFFKTLSLLRVDQSLWSATRTTHPWQDHQTLLPVRLFKSFTVKQNIFMLMMTQKPPSCLTNCISLWR